MTQEQIILQLSSVIAEQRKQIESLEGSNDYLRSLKDKNELKIAELSELVKPFKAG
jgi:uncharacterized coiled-coil protein SlyX